jgi:formylmethanofuran dehydrogenase subunit E
MFISPIKKHTVQEIERFSIKAYIQAFLEELDAEAIKNDIKMMRIKTLETATYIKELLNTPGYKFKTPFMVYQQHYDWQEVDFVPSNLGRGYIFFFICDRCRRKVKHLYQPSKHSQPLCRNCYHLCYKQPDRRTRRLSRLIHKPYLSRGDRERIMKIAKGESHEDLPEIL